MTANSIARFCGHVWSDDPAVLWPDMESALREWVAESRAHGLPEASFPEFARWKLGKMAANIQALTDFVEGYEEENPPDGYLMVPVPDAGSSNDLLARFELCGLHPGFFRDLRTLLSPLLDLREHLLTVGYGNRNTLYLEVTDLENRVCMRTRRYTVEALLPAGRDRLVRATGRAHFMRTACAMLRHRTNIRKATELKSFIEMKGKRND